MRQLAALDELVDGGGRDREAGRYLPNSEQVLRAPAQGAKVLAPGAFDLGVCG